MNHRKDELRDIILELYEGGMPMAQIGRHFLVIELNGEPMVRQHVYYYLKNK